MSITKICLYIPSMNGGGAEKVFANLINEWSKDKYDIDLLLTKKEGQYLDDINEQVNIISLSSKRALYDYKKLRRYILQNKPQVIYSALPHCNMLVILATRFLKNPPKVILTEHSNVPSKIYKNQFKNWLYKKTMRLLYHKSDAIVAVSSGVKKDLQTNIGINKELIHVIYNPIYSQELISKSLLYINDKIYDNPQEIKTILAVGRLTEVKDFTTLILAFSKVSEQIDARLIILGEGPLRIKLENLIKKLRLSDKVFILGFIDNPYNYMRTSDLFVLTSKREGFGNVLVEAMACGTPIISTDCPSGPREILENGKWGQLVPVGDHEKLAEVILTTLGESSHPNVIERAKDFAVEKISHEYLNLLTRTKNIK